MWKGLEVTMWQILKLSGQSEHLRYSVMGSLLGRGNDGFEGFVGHSNKNGGRHKLMHIYLDTHITYMHTHILSSKESFLIYIYAFTQSYGTRIRSFK